MTATAADRLDYVPAVGTCAGLWSAGVPFGLPGDQRPDEALSLVYTSQPIEDDLHVLGRPVVQLRVSTSSSVIGFCASLSEAGPDGSSHLVAKGILNVTRRGSFSEPEPSWPGQIVDLEIPIDATGWTFTRGNRIRVSIANADWPNVWPTPQLATSQVQAEPPSWRVIEDVLTGRKTVEGRYGRRGDPAFFWCTVDPRDPAQASATRAHRDAAAAAEHGDRRCPRDGDPGQRDPPAGYCLMTR